MRRALGTSILAILLLAGLGIGDAQAQTALRKAGRGLAGMTTSFLEVPGNMVQESRDHGLAQGMTLGFVKGLGGIVVRTLVGVYEFVTCPVPLPSNFRPILSPEYPWSYFESQPVSDRRYPRSR